MARRVLRRSRKHKESPTGEKIVGPVEVAGVESEGKGMADQIERRKEDAKGEELGPTMREQTAKETSEEAQALQEEPVNEANHIRVASMPDRRNLLQLKHCGKISQIRTQGPSYRGGWSQGRN